MYPLEGQKGDRQYSTFEFLDFPPDLYLTKCNQKKYNQNYIRQNQNDDTPKSTVNRLILFAGFSFLL